MARPKGARNKPKTQAELNEQFENAPISEKIKTAYVQLYINEFISIRYNIPDNLLKDFIKDFADTLSAKQKVKDSIGANYALDILARSFDFSKRQSERGKKGMITRWGDKAGENA